MQPDYLTPLAYHERTAHDRRRMAHDSLDMRNIPLTFKEYPESLPRITLDAPVFPDATLAQALAALAAPQAPQAFTSAGLAALLALSGGITAVTARPDGEVHFRANASAGALYPIECYLLARDLPGIPDGAYHADPLRLVLTPLRTGPVLSGKGPAAMLALSAVFFRCSWKYRDRAYRYCLLDCGHLMQNTLLAAAALGYAPRPELAFCEPGVNDLLCLDPDREGVLALVRLGGDAAILGPDEWPEPTSLDLPRASRCAPHETVYHLLAAMHHSTGTPFTEPPAPGAPLPPVPKAPSGEWPALEPLVTSRRSRRGFFPMPADEDVFDAFAGIMTAGLPEGLRQPGRMAELRFFLSEVDGASPGVYAYGPEAGGLVRVQPEFSATGFASAGLNQQWLSHAAFHVGMVADLEALDLKFGPRGYRLAMIDAGRAGQLANLAAEALDMGACGIGSFFDAEAGRLLGLGGAERLLYFVAVGPVR